MKYIILLLIIVFFIFTSFISPQLPGDLDTTIGISVMVRIDIAGYYDGDCSMTCFY